MSTILKWAGNKTAIMPELIKRLPKGRCLVEPFAGSCAVMMATGYSKYLVADINPDLINLYQVIKADSEAFIQGLRDLWHDTNNADSYYLIRKAFNDSAVKADSYIRAVYFLYLNRHGYRGMCRYNRKGEFNIPYGNYKNPYLPENEIRAFAEKAQHATFICAGFEETMSMLRKGDVVYCDPPYDGTFSDYHTDGFTEVDQRRLAEVLERRSSEGYPVVVSNSDTALTRSLYRNFDVHSLTAPRSIGVAAGEKKSANEIIATIQKPYCVGK